MNNRLCFEALDRSLQNIQGDVDRRHQNKMFGERFLINTSCYHWRKKDVINVSLSISPLWQRFKILILKETYVSVDGVTLSQ